MESNDSQSFCTYCGQFLDTDVRFCPGCGTRVPGRNPDDVQQERQVVKDALDRQLRWAAYMMLVYSIPFLLIGLYVIIVADELAEVLMNDPTFRGYIDYYGFTIDDVRGYFEYAGFAYLTSSIFGIASAFLCMKRARFWLATLLCILSVLSGVAGFFALFLGLFAFWFIISARLGFKEKEEELNAALDQIQ